MGGGLWFKHGDQDAPKCTNCRQEEANGSDGLCAECRRIMKLSKKQRPVFGEIASPKKATFGA